MLLRWARKKARIPSIWHSSAPVNRTPDVEVLRRLGIELLGQREGGGHAGGVVVGAGDDIGELDVDEEEHADQQDQRRDQLEEGDQAGVDAGHPGAEDREEDRERPEEDAERGEGKGRRLASREARATRFGLEDAARPGGVVVGADEEAGGRLGPLAGRDDVLGRPAEEQPAERGRSGRSGRGTSREPRPAPSRSRRAGRGSRRGCRRSRGRSAALGRARTGGARRWAPPRRGGRHRAARFASQLAARRSASVPARRPSNEQSSSMTSMRAAASTSGGLSRGGQINPAAWLFSHAYDW